jgi:site-specific recombinase XerD
VNLRPINVHIGGSEYPGQNVPSSADPPQGLIRSTDNTVAVFLTFLAGEQVSARTARLYLGHLGRFAAWLREQYRAELVDATSHDLREYRARLAERQKPASVNAALAALQRFYGWARDTGRIKTNPTAKLKAVASQPLAPQGFTSIERQRLRREAERAGPMPDAIVTTLLNTGLRVDELIHLTWDDVTLLPRSGKAAIRKGKGDKARTVPLNTLVRDALNGVRPTLVEGPIFRGRRGPYTDRGIRNLLAVLGRRANVPHVHPHRFRHDTARRLVEHVDLPTVAALLGHSRLDTVRIYAQPDMEALERAAATLERSDASSP